jgi:hypothetical protein
LLKKFARRVALDVIHLWPDAPPVVVEYLKTGDESLRESAESAARAEEWAASTQSAGWAASAASAAARPVESARCGAWSVAAAAQSAVEAEWAASVAVPWSARAKEWTAAKEKTELYRKWFLEEVENAFSKA